MPNQRRFVLLSIAFGLFIAMTGTASAQLRIVNYNVASLNGNTTNLEGVFAALAADDKPGFAVAPHLYAFGEVQSTDVGPLLAYLNNSAPSGVSYTQGTFTFNTPPNTNENGSAGAQALFYRADVLTEDAAAHVDISTGAGRNADRWKLNLVGYTSPQASFYIYSMHLKASTGSANEATRLSGATAVRNNADLLPAGTHIIYAGDFNVYSNTETPYLKFLSTGNGQAIDPLGTGSWAGAANAIKHTQAPCAGNCTLVAGGMDDRFDHQLSTQAFQDGEGLALIPGTFRSFGNDGNHYDQSINSGNNSYYPADIPRSNALAAKLYTASDHVPVVADYQVPAVLAATMPANFGRVIQGAAFDVIANVYNAAVAQVAAGADELDFAATGSGALSGTLSGAVAALAGPAAVGFAVDTLTVGAINGAMDISSNSQGVQNSPQHLTTAGIIVRPANGSFSDSQDEDAMTVLLTLAPDTGVQAIDVDLFNLGFDAFQAQLDVDGVGGLAPPFALVGPLPTNIAGAGATLPLSIDTSGLTPGSYTANLSVQVSDENIPGESNATLELTVTIQLGINPLPADVNCDGTLNMSDVDAFVEVLLGLDAVACHVSQADFDHSTVADGLDIPQFVDSFLN